MTSYFSNLDIWIDHLVDTYLSNVAITDFLARENAPTPFTGTASALKSISHSVLTFLKLKADRPHPRNYPHTPLSNTNKHQQTI